MKRTLIGLFVLIIGSSTVFAQGEADAYRLSQTELTGTARFVSMGGAFGALGGDISVMSYNPAGLAIYRSSEVLTSLNLNFTDTKTSWSGSNHDQSKTRFNFSNIGYVGYFPTGNESGLKGWNIGFAYKRVKDFHRNYFMSSQNLQNRQSLSDYMAVDANLNGYTGKDLGITASHDPWRGYNWMSTLGYNAGIIQADEKDHEVKNKLFNPYGKWQGDDWSLYNVQLATLKMQERGAIDDYDFSMAFNFSDQIFIGATVTLTDLYYKMFSGYYENFGKTLTSAPHESDFYLDNTLRTTGTGYSFNLGVLVRPTDFLRLGLAYNSPIWYNMTDRYHARAGARVYTDDLSYDKNKETPNGITEYKMRSPDRWIFSAAGIIGQSGLISFDYELTNYKNTKLNPRDGHNYDYAFENRHIKDDFGISHTFKIGAEYKVTPQFSIRAGTMWQTSSVKSHMANGKSEVFASGTRPNYTLTKGINSNYTFGLGYRFTPNFYMDLACVYNTYKDELYPFSSIFYENKETKQIEKPIQSYPGELKTNRTSVYLTFGYKF